MSVELGKTLNFREFEDAVMNLTHQSKGNHSLPLKRKPSVKK